MRNIWLSILICIATGVLFSHQVIVHHHHEEAVAAHPSDGQDQDDSDSDHLPPHHIADNFSPDNAFHQFVKIRTQNIYTDLMIDLSKPLVIESTQKEILPPGSESYELTYYKRFRFRGPPVL